jgi:hypothetical protein
MILDTAPRMKVELQTATKRFPLLDIPSSQIPAFPAGCSHDYVVKHNVVEEGTHMYVLLSSLCEMNERSARAEWNAHSKRGNGGREEGRACMREECQEKV